MTKRNSEVQEEGLPAPERESIWDLIVGEWLAVRDISGTAERLREELELAGIHTPDEVIKAPISVLQGAVRAVMQADAQALTGAVLRVLQRESKT